MVRLDPLYELWLFLCLIKILESHRKSLNRAGCYSPGQGVRGEDRPLYCSAHGADGKLCLIGHDVRGLYVAVVHWVLEGGSPIGVLVTCVAVERDLGSSPGRR